MQVGVVHREWQWTVSEEVADEKESSSWRKSGASRPARLRESSSTKLILRMGMWRKMLWAKRRQATTSETESEPSTKGLYITL